MKKTKIKNRIILLVIAVSLLLPGCTSKGPVTAPDVSGTEITGRSEKTTAVYNYIRDNFGTVILSAQQESRSEERRVGKEC